MPRSSIDLVREFHLAFGHPVSDAPTESTPDLRVLRVKLIAEELVELCFALGVSLSIDTNLVRQTEFVEAKVSSKFVDLVEAADALGDLDYVVQGANLVFGFPVKTIMEEIHRSNMSKLGPDGKPIYREDGKVMKGPNYSPPNIAPLLEFITVKQEVSE